MHLHRQEAAVEGVRWQEIGGGIFQTSLWVSESSLYGAKLSVIH